ncbi:MAG: DUF3945 domain-containing protein [Prevotellaceae bacterium]|jgi:hypothetical protein|nr:DUF3945 domain-containing protein [Prevotellaceae bacterium]
METDADKEIRADIFEVSLGMDAEKAARLEKLCKSESVEISGKEVPYSEDLRVYRRNALEYGRNLRGTYANKDTGEVVMLTSSKNNGGLKEILQHDYQDKEHVQSIAAIPKIVENAIFITQLVNEDYLKHPNMVAYRYYACGLKIDSVDYTVKMVVGVMNDGSRYYDHRLTQIEKGRLIDFVQLLQQKTSPNHANGLTSPSLQLSEDTVLDETCGASTPPLTSDYKDKRLLSILQTKAVKKIGGVELSPGQQQALAAGEVVKLENVTDKIGRKQTVYAQWDTEKGSPRLYRNTPDRKVVQQERQNRKIHL